MASYIITNNTNSFTIKKDNNSNPYSRNDLRIKFSDDSNQILKIFDKDVNSYLLYEIDLNVDTVNVSGVTSFANAEALFTALEPIFFLINTASSTGLQDRVIVNQSNYLTTLGGTIDSTKEYFIDGVVDMGSTSIEIPSTGINLTGYNFDTSRLISSEDSYTMFVSAVGGSGNVLGKDFDIQVTGAGSKVYNLTDATGFNAFEFARVNYTNCSSLGEINGYRQGLEEGTGRFGASPSLTLSGTWLGGYRITTSIVRSLAGTMTEPLFKAGTAFQMNSRFKTDINCDLPTLAAFTDFAPSNFPNPSTVQIQDAIFTRDGALDAEDTNITPNLSMGDLPCYWKRNVGIDNTYVGGTATVVLQSATNITVQGQYELLNAQAWLGNNLEHFTMSADGKLQHNGVSPREFEITYGLNLEGTANNDILFKLYKYDAKNTSEVALDYTFQERSINNFVGGRDLAFFNGVIGATLDQGDQIYIKIANNSGTNNITAEGFSFLRVQER